jgi:hypothetical protein
MSRDLRGETRSGIDSHYTIDCKPIWTINADTEYPYTEKRLKIGIIPKIIFGAQEAPILAGFERF